MEQRDKSGSAPDRALQAVSSQLHVANLNLRQAMDRRGRKDLTEKPVLATMKLLRRRPRALTLHNFHGDSAYPQQPTAGLATPSYGWEEDTYGAPHEQEPAPNVAEEFYEDEEQYYDAPQELTYGHASASTMPGYEAAEGALTQAVATYAHSQDSQPTPQPCPAVGARYKASYYKGLVNPDEDVEKHGLDCLEGLGARYPGHKIDYGWFCPFVRETSRAYFDRMTRQYSESTRPQREAMCAIAGLTGHFFEFMLQYQEHGPLWEWPLESWRRFVTGTWQEGDDDFWPDRGGDDDDDDEGWMAWLLSFLPNRELPSQGIEDLVDIGRPPGSTRP
ncbi:hypothetical protein B0A55_04609 [Friedmanniomyces simplex]|uniref:Uncharacterized protein n=1 Tax=Friedmanniomyces simplex TaxID=329884 RepID=A0A4U0XPY4_9PEZI|nr:hypothetical protein B0A55_04609 [Friedmanniomyces simplex]